MGRRQEWKTYRYGFAAWCIRWGLWTLGKAISKAAWASSNVTIPLTRETLDAALNDADALRSRIIELTTGYEEWAGKLQARARELITGLFTVRVIKADKEDGIWYLVIKGQGTDVTLPMTTGGDPKIEMVLVQWKTLRDRLLVGPLTEASGLIKLGDGKHGVQSGPGKFSLPQGSKEVGQGSRTGPEPVAPAPEPTRNRPQTQRASQKEDKIRAGRQSHVDTSKPAVGKTNLRSSTDRKADKEKARAARRGEHGLVDKPAKSGQVAVATEAHPEGEWQDPPARETKVATVSIELPADSPVVKAIAAGVKLDTSMGVKVSDKGDEPDVPGVADKDVVDIKIDANSAKSKNILQGMVWSGISGIKADPRDPRKIKTRVIWSTAINRSVESASLRWRRGIESEVQRLAEEFMETKDVR